MSDEPLYAHYLQRTGLDHPMRDEVLRSQPTSWKEATAALSGPCSRPLWYQKHMAHHWESGLDLGWCGRFRHGLLIRHPARVVSSYARVREPHPSELGFLQQVALLDALDAMGCDVVIIDSTDIRRAPAVALEALCQRLGVAFDPCMLTWRAGPHPDDGVWGPAWYPRVWASTTFAPCEGGLPVVDTAMRPVVEALMPAWRRLSESPKRVRLTSAL